MTTYIFITDTTCDNQPLGMVIRETDDVAQFVANLFEANGDCDHVRFMPLTGDGLMRDWTEFDVIYREE